MRLGDITYVNGLNCPERIALVLGDSRVTYGDLENQSQRIAYDLVQKGIGPGRRVALVEKTSPECIIFSLAILKTGAMLVPINNLLQPRELQFILSDCDPTIVVHGEEYGQLIQEAIEPLPDPPSLFRIPRRSEIQTFLKKIEPSDIRLPDFSEQEPCMFLYTAGTTGVPKAAIYNHENFWKNLLSTVIDTYMQSYGDIWLGPIPLYHIGGFGTMMRAFLMANTLVLRERFDPEAYLDTIEKEKVTILYAYPTMINALVNVIECVSFDLTSLKLVVYGGSPMPQVLLAKAYRTFACDFVQRYGSTECCGVAITVLSPADHQRAMEDPQGWGEKLTSVGRPSLGTLVRLEDDSGRILKGPGERGEIVVRLDAPMVGYWKRPEDTAQTLKDGWLYTGDVGTWDKDGYLYIVDRKKDMIISGARNIYPREIETILYRHPAVMEAAVIGVPDEYWGESVKAVIALKPGHYATEEEIIAFCKERLASYKKPRSVEFMEALPKTPSGKVLKRELRERYWEGLDRRVH